MRNKFSLLELLVVMAVISILLSLTLPAITNARRKAQQKVCMSNLRNIGQGAVIYALEHDDYTMPANFGDTVNGGYGHFINYMIAELEYSHSSFICPSMDEEFMFDPSGHDPTTGNIYKTASYIMNIIKPGQWNGADITRKSDAHGWGLKSTLPINTGTVTFPSQKLFIMDVIEDISDSHSGVNSFQRSDHGVVNTPPTGLTRWIGTHHSYKFNVVFGDGHVETIFRSDDISWAVNR